MAQPRTAAEPKRAEPAKPASTTRPPSNILPLNFDLHGIDALKKELQQLSATNQEILKAFQARELPAAKPKDFGSSGNIVLPPEADELAKYKSDYDALKKACETLKKENDSLRRRCADAEAKIKAGFPTLVKEQQREFEQLLEEKTETIRSLHMHIQELQEEMQKGQQANAELPSRGQLDLREEELARIEQQLLADQESLNKQAREMEMSMAKERAELARQRADMQRLQSDIQREMELAARDPGLRERLMNLQRRPDNRPRTAGSLPTTPAPAPAPKTGTMAALPTRVMKAPPTVTQKRPSTMAAIDLDGDDTDQTPQQRGGFLKRLFGG